MENFNNVPEPATPDESQRVEDVAKAQTMAEAEKPLRDYAGQFDRAKDAPIDDSSKNYNNKKFVEVSTNRPDMVTNISKRKDGSVVEYAGKAYVGVDKSMPNEEFRDMLSKRAEDAKKEAEEKGENAGEEYEVKQKEEARQEELKKVKENLGI